MGDGLIKGRLSRLAKKSKDYIAENEQDVKKLNVYLLKIISLAYTVLLVIYWIAAYFIFDGYRQISQAYAITFVIQIVFTIFIWIRYKEERTTREIMNACSGLQLFVMSFVTFISVFPTSIDVPGLYFSPIVIAFSVMFMFPVMRTFLLALVEAAGLLVVTAIFEDVGMLLTHTFLCLLTLIVVYICVYVIVTSRILEGQTKKHILKKSETDELTGLQNKASTEYDCARYIEKEMKQSCALMIIDFDDFKLVNDSFGHSQGDEVLKEFGKVLRQAVNGEDIVGRIGGDEFLILLKECVDMKVAEEKAKTIQKNTHLILCDIIKYEFSCSIGVAMCDDTEETFQNLFVKADKALYKAKEHGKDTFAFYSIESPAFSISEQKE